MEYRELRCPPDDADWIHCLWLLWSAGGGVESVVPDGRPELVIHLGEPYAQVDPDGTRRPQRQVMVSGQLTRPIRLAPCGEAEIVGIRLSPALAGRVLPIGELTDQVVPLHEVNRRLAAALLDAAASRQPAAERLAAVRAVLRRFARHEPDRLPIETVRTLDRGTPRLRDVARACGVTPRTLQRRFREAVGVTAKMYHRIARFRRAIRTLRSGRPAGVAAVAVLAGYYDQAHLIRDFRRFAGAAPSRFFQTGPGLAMALLGEGPDA